MGRRLETVASSVSLQRAGLILSTSWALRTLLACSLPPFPSSSVQTPWTWMGPEHMPNAPGQVQSPGRDDPRRSWGSRDAVLGQASTSAVSASKQCCFALHPHLCGKDSTHFHTAQQQSPACLTKGQTAPTWASQGPLQSSGSEIPWQRSIKKGASQGNTHCATELMAEATSPENSCHGNLNVFLSQKQYMWMIPLKQRLPDTWTKKIDLKKKRLVGGYWVPDPDPKFPLLPVSPRYRYVPIKSLVCATQ